MKSEQAILDATVKIVQKAGYAGLTVDKIAVLAKASKTTIYRRWPTKEHILIAVLDQHPLVVPVDRGNLRDELLDVYAGKSAQVAETDPMQQVASKLFGEAAGNPALKASMNAFNEKRRMPLRVLLTRAISRGELPKGTDIELAIDFMQGSIYVRGFMLDRALSRKWVDSMIKTLIRGLGGKIK